MKVFEKLALRIKKDLGFELVNFHRTYAGFHQRSNGGFVWVAEFKDSNSDTGSCWSATKLLKSKNKLIKLTYEQGNNTEIIADE